MECDLGALQIAIEVAVEAASDRNEFLAAIHGIELKKPKPLPTTAEELNQNALNAMRALGSRRVEAA